MRLIQRLRRDHCETKRAVVAAHDVKARAAGPLVGAQLDARDAEQWNLARGVEVGGAILKAKIKHTIEKRYRNS